MARNFNLTDWGGLTHLSEPSHGQPSLSAWSRRGEKEPNLTKSKIFKGFLNVPFNAVVFEGLDFFGLPQRKFLEWTRGNHL
jgi:hypothetical protein